ncbi:multidrug effflux MFS transporter [Nocardioides sp. zg-536]|uniref:Multidrug effflux MFS transporter n=1 Tax=Nocardioides faecalis TaxID=2803858 RepID=A0A938Y6Z7_9ACTN|nr:multidrug effflux MFS transporter [Nocardioides faecalis]MBM9461223.1 multidrug effflux MFS transporter [Nocardioides faecalis]QVI59068.1 multidrug effflux MFS transporter [Nocardioides faecalis]
MTTTPTRADTTTRVTLGVTVTLGLLAGLGPLSTDMHLPGLPEIADALETTDAAAASTVTVGFAGLALGQLLVGGLTDRFGRRRPALVCLALFVLASVACALAPSIEVLLVARFLQGVFGAGSVVAARASVRDLAQGPAASRLYSQLAMISMFAPVIAPLLGGQVLAFTSWRGIFATLGVLAAALLLLASVKMPESLAAEHRRRADGPGQLRVMGQVLRHRGFAQHLVLAVCQGVILVSYLTMSALFLRAEHGVGSQQYSLIFATSGAGMVLGHVVNMRLVPRFGSLNMLTFSVTAAFTSCSLLCLAVFTHAPLPVVLVPLCLTLPLLTPSMPNNMALALVPFGTAAGTASALLGASQQVAGAVVPSLAVQVGSSGAVMATTMLLAAGVGLVQVWGVVRPALRRGDVPDFSGSDVVAADVGGTDVALPGTAVEPR